MDEINESSMTDYNRRLNAISIRLTETATEEQLFQEIAASFRELTGAFVASASRYDRQRNTLALAALSIDERVDAQTSAMLKSSFASTEMSPPPEILQLMIAQVVNRPKTLTELTFGVIPEDFSAQIMQMLGIEEIIALPMSYGAEVMGTVIAYHSGTSRPIPDEALKTFAYMAGATIARRKSEQALRESVRGLGLLSEIGRRIDQTPLIPEFLGWVAAEIPHAMRDPDQCVVAIEFERWVYGDAQAIDLPNQIVGGLRIGGELRGKVVTAYRTASDFVDEESALLGDIVRRLSVYIENRRLLEESQNRVLHEQMLREIATQMRGSTDADEIVRIAIGAVGSTLGRLAFIYLPAATQDSDAIGYRFDGADVTPVDLDPTAIEDGATTLISPLAIRGYPTAGMLGVEEDPANPLTADERTLVNNIAEQTILALETAHLFTQTQAALAEVEATHQSYLQREWQIYLRQRESLLRNGFVYDQNQVGILPDLWLPEMEQAVAERSTVVVTGDGAEQTSLTVPIVLRGQVIGVLGIRDPKGKLQWSTEERDLMQEIGLQLGLALENARLLEDTRAQAAREQLLGEISTRIRAEIEIESLLERALEELGSALEAERAVIHLAGAETISPADPTQLEVLE